MTATKTAIIHHLPLDKNFTKVSNSIIINRDDVGDLAYRVHSVVMSLPPNALHYLTPTSIYYLINPHTGTPYFKRGKKCGLKSMRKAFNELKLAGYSQILFRHNLKTGERINSTWLFYNLPQPKTGIDLFRPVEVDENGNEKYGPIRGAQNINPYVAFDKPDAEQPVNQYDLMMVQLASDQQQIEKALKKYDWLTPQLLEQYRPLFKQNPNSGRNLNDYKKFARHFLNWLSSCQTYQNKYTNTPITPSTPSASSAVQAASSGKAMTPNERMAFIYQELQYPSTDKDLAWFSRKCDTFIGFGRINFANITPEWQSQVEALEQRKGNPTALNELFNKIKERQTRLAQESKLRAEAYHAEQMGATTPPLLRAFPSY